MKVIELIVPDQTEGWQSNTEESEKTHNSADAIMLYSLAAKRLLDVNSWQKLDTKMLAEFHLSNQQGNDVNRPAQKGDFFKIKAPAPTADAGDGYDWVQVEKVGEINKYDEQVTYMIVHPSSNPTIKTDETAHFFKPEASSCFVVYRNENKVTAAVYGRNEKPNTEAESLLDKARNAIVAIGAFAGFAKLQWKSLVKGLLSVEND